MARQSDPINLGIGSPLGAAFIHMAAIVSIPIAIATLLLSGLSVQSDTVFGAEALVGGLITYWIYLRFLGRRLVVAERVPISFVWVWALLCGFVMIVRPFQ